MPGITKAAIQQWEQELKTLPEKIQELHSEIKAHQDKIKQLEPELKTVNAEIVPIDVIIESIKARTEIIESTSQIANLEPKIPPHQAVVDELTPQLEDTKKLLLPICKEISRLKRVIYTKELQLKIEELKNSIPQHKLTLDNKNSLYRIAKASYDACYAEIEQIKGQIRTLENQNREDEGKIASQPQPQPLPVLVGQPQPLPMIVGQPQPQPVPCYDQNSIIREIASRNAQIVQYRRTLEIKRNAEAAYDQELHRLKAERDQCEAEINELNTQLLNNQIYLASSSQQEISEANSESLSTLRVKLECQKTIRTPHESKALCLQKQIDVHATQVTILNNTMGRLKKKIDALTSKANRFADINDVADLQLRLKQQEDLKKPLSDESKRLSDAIDKEASSINVAKSNIKEHQKLLDRHHANRFLIGLRDHPEQAFENIIQAVHAKLADYDYKYPEQQIYRVRAYLLNFEENIQRIRNLNLPVSDTEQTSLLDNPQVKKYLILCGSFWEMINALESEGKHTQFNYLLKEALKEHVIDPALCSEAYAPYHVMPISESQLNAYEQKRYDEARQAFTTTLSTIPPEKKFKKFHQLGDEILNRVDVRLSKDIDIKYAILILENSNDLALYPKNRTYQYRQRLLADNVHIEKSANKKRIGGILLMFLGAAITLGSSIGCVFTPFSAIGIGVGVTTFAVGLGFFRSSKKGLRLSMENFEKVGNVVGDYTPPAPPPYAPEPSAPEIDKGIFTKLR